MFFGGYLGNMCMVFHVISIKLLVLNLKHVPFVFIFLSVCSILSIGTNALRYLD